MKNLSHFPTAIVNKWIKVTPDQLREFADRLELASKEIKTFGQAATVQFSDGIQLYYEPLTLPKVTNYDKTNPKILIPTRIDAECGTA